MTEEETKKWEQKVKREAARTKQRAEGGGVKISVAAAAGSQAVAPPIVASAPSGTSQG